jgi:hypothetical protein
MVPSKMKTVIAALVVLGVVAAGKGDGGKPAPGPSKDSYVKMRVEVEIRGTVHITEKDATVTALYRGYSFTDENKVTNSREETWKLDFSKARDLHGTAKALDGKEVVITGLSELRQLMQPPAPAGGPGFNPGPMPYLPGPSWHVHHTVLVTGVRLADGK